MESSQVKAILNSLVLVNKDKSLVVKFYEIFDESKIFHLWPSSRFVAFYIFQFSEKFQGKHIFELGSGIGVIGLVKFFFFLKKHDQFLIIFSYA